MKILNEVCTWRRVARLLMLTAVFGLTVAAWADQALILGPTVSGGNSSLEAKAAQSAGLTVNVVDNATWESMTTADFAQYRVIIIGDPTCTADPAVATAATMTTSVWGPAVNGNVIINGTDPAFHAPYEPGAGVMITKSVAFAASQAGKTGLYVSLSCEYISDSTPTQVAVLNALADGPFDAKQASGCYNQVHIVATHPALAGLTDADLSNWSCSVHEVFTTWPADFTVLAIAEGLGSVYTASDGTVGTPYVLARGAGLKALSNIDLSPLVAKDTTGASQLLSATVTTNTPSPNTPVSGTQVNFTVVSGPDGGLTSSANTNGSGIAQFTLTNNGHAGTDVVKATFVDSSGHTETSSVATITFSVDNPPVFAVTTPATGYTVYTGKSVSFTVTANDPDSGDEVTLSATGVPGTASLSGVPATANPVSASFSWTPTSTDVGSYSIVFTAKDVAGHAATYTVPVVVQQSQATVTLTNLTQTYNGSPLSPSVTTVPAGLATLMTGAPEVNAGTYTVTVTVNDPDYVGTATQTFTIKPAPATVSLGNLVQTYSGAELAPSVATVPAGLSTSFSGAPDVNAGTYPVIATVTDPNYVGSAAGTFTVNPAPASVSFGNIVQTYTSGPLAPTVTTAPAGLAYSMSGAPDIAAGSYAVTATVTNPNYVGSGSTPFTIQQAPATIALSNLSQVYSGNPESATATVTPAYCGPASVTYAGGAALPSNIGTYPVVAIEANPNCTAPNATGTLIVNAFAASSCVYALNPTARGAFSVSDGATVDAQCSIQVNSASRDAFDVDGHKSTVDATAISVVGGASIDRSSTVSNAPATGQASVADPLAALVAPSVGACVNAGDHDSDGDQQHGAAGKSITMNPGTYCGGIHINGRSTVTFNPGTYILLGGGLNIDGGAQVTGTGVTFYNTGDHEHRYQPIHIDGGSKTTLSAPVSGSLAGVLFFQDRNIAQHGDADDHDGSNELQGQANTITGNTESSFTGALYFPTTPLVYAGGSEQDPAAYTLIVADTVSVAAHSNVSLTVLGTPMSDTDADVCSPGKDCHPDKDGNHN